MSRGSRPWVIVVIAEKRDRSSQAKLPEVVEAVERQNAAIYWLTWSPALAPYTQRPPKRADRETPEERRKDRNRDDPVPAPPAPPMNLLAGIAELAHLAKPDLADLFSRTTGGRTMNFLKKNALEQAIQAVGDEVHRQYILTFQPRGGGDGRYHALRVEVRGRPELRVKTREGYWSVP